VILAKFFPFDKKMKGLPDGLLLGDASVVGEDVPGEHVHEEQVHTQVPDIVCYLIKHYKGFLGMDHMYCTRKK
jgi:hypothetical protein